MRGDPDIIIDNAYTTMIPICQEQSEITTGGDPQAEALIPGRPATRAHANSASSAFDPANSALTA